MASLVLFVCTGNICRSPMAEYAARSRFDGAWRFGSAGVGAVAGHPASDHAVAVMDEIGVDLRPHRSRSLRNVADEPGLILAMTGDHLRDIARMRPDLAPHARLLRPDGASIADPYGLDLATYRRTRDDIMTALEERLEGLSETPIQP